MDPLSDFLSTLNVTSSLSASLQTGGDWALRFPRYEGIKFNSLVSGACWLTLEGAAESIYLQPGDCCLLTDGRPFRLGSDLELPAEDGYKVYGQAKDSMVQYGPSTDLRMMGGRFTFDNQDASLLLDTLPPVIHISGTSSQAETVRWVLERLHAQLSNTLPGASLMAEYLAHIMLVQVLQSFIASETRQATGWLGALADAKIGQVIRCLHQHPDRRWTLHELANAVGMSRSTLALRFKALVGVAPLNYLLHWRIRLAKQALRNREKQSIAAIAWSMGYESESAFSNAFKRVTGVAPTRYRDAESAPQVG